MNDGDPPGRLGPLPPFARTGIGSLPHRDPEAALDLVAAAALDLPFWPQLPGRGFAEQMIAQAAAELFFLDIDSAAGRVRVPTGATRSERTAEALERTAGGGGRPRGDEPAGWEPFLRRFTDRGAVKGQIAGPVTVGLAVSDEDGRALCRSEEWRELLIQGLAAAAGRQARRLGAPGRTVLLSIDEPLLGAPGEAADRGVSRQEMVEALSAVVAGVHAAGAAAAIHCCGPADWSVAVTAGADAVLADAFLHGRSLCASAVALDHLLRRGGRIGWGLVPTSPGDLDATLDELEARFRDAADGLVRAGIDRALLGAGSLLTPACGCGGLTEAESAGVFARLSALRRRLLPSPAGRRGAR